MTILLLSATCAIDGEVILPSQHEPYQAILGNGILGIDPNSGSQASGEVWGIAPYESLDDVVNFPGRKVPQSALLPSPSQTIGHGQLIAPLWFNPSSSVQPEFPLLSPIIGINLASPLKRPKNKNRSNKNRTKHPNSNHNSKPHIIAASGEMPMKVYSRPSSASSASSTPHAQPASSSSNTVSHTYDDRDKEISSEKDVEIVEESKYSSSKAKPLRRFGITKAIFKMFKSKDKPKGMPPVRHAHDHFHHEHLHHHHHHYHHHIHHYPGKMMKF